MKSFLQENKLSLIILLVIFINFPLYSQVRTLSIDDAIDLAIKNNTDAKLAILEIHKADAAVNEAFGYALPSVDVGYTFSHFFEKPMMPFPDFGALLGNSVYSVLFDEGVLPRDDNKFKEMGYSLQSFSLANNFEASVSVTQILFNSAVFRGIGASKIYSDLSREAYKSTISSTVLKVKKAFYGAVVTYKFYEITKQSFDNAQQNLKNVRALNAEGLVSEFDLLQAEVRVENIRPALQQIENQYKTTIDGLKIILGIDQSEKIEVSGDLVYNNLSIPEENSLINEAKNNNYDLATLKLKEEVDDAFIDLDRSDYWPTIAAFGSYSYNGAGDQFDFMTYRSGIVGLNFSINLFKGNQTKYRVQQAKIEAIKTNEQIQQLEHFISQQVVQMTMELKRVQSNIEAQDRNITLAQKAYDIATIRYKEGTGNQLEVENADIALSQARTNKLQSVYDYMISVAELDKLLGRTNKSYFKRLEDLKDGSSGLPD